MRKKEGEIRFFAAQNAAKNQLSTQNRNDFQAGARKIRTVLWYTPGRATLPFGSTS
jgi:hypothetical protein